MWKSTALGDMVKLEMLAPSFIHYTETKGERQTDIGG
jgi:hypothetical protein